MALTRRQKQIYDFIGDFIERKGYSPSLEEIGSHFGLSSVATVHKHVTNLVRKGLLRRSWNQNRSIEVVREDDAPRAVEIPIVGSIRAGRPMESRDAGEMVSVPSWLVGQGRTYGLVADAESLGREQIREGDLVVVEERRSADDGQIVVALVHGEEPEFRRFYQDPSGVRLENTQRPEQPFVVPSQRVEVRGVVRGVVRKY